MIPPGCRACHCPKCMEALQYSFRNVGDVAQSSSNYAIPKMHASGFRTPEYHRAYRVWAITNLGYGPYNIILHTVHSGRAEVLACNHNAATCTSLETGPTVVCTPLGY